MTEEQGNQGFTVTDKRTFREDGQLREETAKSEAGKRAGGPPASTGGETQQAQSGAGELPPIDFPSYILSYYTQGLVLLGEVPNPYTNKQEEDLEASRHTINVLAMLQEKTRGNLTKEEDQLLDSVLYELRMKFMAKTSRIKL